MINLAKAIEFVNNVYWINKDDWRIKVLRQLFDVFNSEDSYIIPPAYWFWVRKHLVLNNWLTISVQDSAAHRSKWCNDLFPAVFECLITKQIRELINFNFPNADEVQSLSLIILIQLIRQAWWINIEATLWSHTYKKTNNSIS